MYGGGFAREARFGPPHHRPVDEHGREPGATSTDLGPQQRPGEGGQRVGWFPSGPPADAPRPEDIGSAHCGQITTAHYRPVTCPAHRPRLTVARSPRSYAATSGPRTWHGRHHLGGPALEGHLRSSAHPGGRVRLLGVVGPGPVVLRRRMGLPGPAWPLALTGQPGQHLVPPQRALVDAAHPFVAGPVQRLPLEQLLALYHPRPGPADRRHAPVLAVVVAGGRDDHGSPWRPWACSGSSAPGRRT